MPIDDAGKTQELAERQVLAQADGFFLEDWSEEGLSWLDERKWSIAGTGTGTIIRTIATNYVYSALSGATNADTMRLVSLRRWRVGPDTWAQTSINRKLVVEFEAKFDTVASIENTTFFAGLSASNTATRATDNLAGWILTADALNAITDDGVGETVSAVGAPAVAAWHKLRMELYASYLTGAWSGHVDFYVDEVLQATHTTAAAEDLPDQLMYLNFYVPQEAAANSGGFHLGPIRVFYSQPPAHIMDPIGSSIAYLKALVSRGMLCLQGTCDSEMTGSTTAIYSDDLAGFGDDYFNTNYVLRVIKNADAIGAAPDSEERDITDYVSLSGGFTTDAFTVNVEANDVILVINKDLAESWDTIADIYDEVSALLTTKETGGSITAPDVAGTEITVFSHVPGTVSKPIMVKINLDAMLAGDTTEIREKYRYASAGAWIQEDYSQFVGADGGLINSNKLITVELSPNRYGVQVTLAMTGGVVRAYPFFASYED